MRTLTRRAWFGLVAVLPFLRPKPAYVQGILRRDAVTFPVCFDKVKQDTRCLIVYSDELELVHVLAQAKKRYMGDFRRICWRHGALNGRGYNFIGLYKPDGTEWLERTRSQHRNVLVDASRHAEGSALWMEATRFNQWVTAIAYARLQRNGVLTRMN